MKKRIVLFVLSLLLIVGMLSAGNAYAWFSSLQGGSTVANRIKAGTISYSLGDSVFIVTAEGEKVYPEQNLLQGTVSLANSSDIQTCVRVKVVYAYGTTEPLTWSTWNPNDDSDDLSVTLGSGWTYYTGNSFDGYVYYGSNTNNTISNTTVAANSSPIPLFSKICLSGANTDNSMAGRHMTVKVIYEARQREILKEAWTYTAS